MWQTGCVEDQRFLEPMCRRPDLANGQGCTQLCTCVSIFSMVELRISESKYSISLSIFVICISHYCGFYFG